MVADVRESQPYGEVLRALQPGQQEKEVRGDTLVRVTSL